MPANKLENFIVKENFDGKTLSIFIDNTKNIIVVAFQLHNEAFEWFNITIKFVEISTFRFQTLEIFQNIALFDKIQYLKQNEKNYFCFQSYGEVKTIDEFLQSEMFIVCNNFEVLEEIKL